MAKVSLDDLAVEYADVLDLFEISEGSAEFTRRLAPLHDRLHSLREVLLEQAFDYAVAHELLASGLPECDEERRESRTVVGPTDANGGGGLFAGERLAKRAGSRKGSKSSGKAAEPCLIQKEDETRRRSDRWRRFHSHEFAHYSLWSMLVFETWLIWGFVERPEAVSVPDETVCGRLLASLQEMETGRLGLRPDLRSIDGRFEDCRDAAWRVVAEEVLKALSGNQKPGRTGYSSLQREYDVERGRFSSSDALGFYGWRLQLGPKLIRQLNETRKMHKVLHKLLEAKVGMELTDIPKEHLRRERARFDKEHNDGIPPSNRLAFGLLWTSANLPLCLMKPSAAAKATLAVLQNRFGVGVLKSAPAREPKGKKPAQRHGLAGLEQDLRVMTNEKGLRPFLTFYLHGESKVRIITDLVFRHSGISEVLKNDDPSSYVHLPANAAKHAAETDNTGQTSKNLRERISYGTLLAEIRLQKGVEVSGFEKLRLIFGEGYDVKAISHTDAGEIG